MTAVLVVDMLNEFVTGKLRCDGAQNVIPNIKALLPAARARGYPVVFTNDAHRPEGDREFEIWGPHAIAGTDAAQIIPELAAKPSDYIVPKRRYSGFQGTDLDMFLQESGVDEVVLTGLATNICVRHTCADAFFNGYKLTVPEDAVGAFTQKDHIEGLAYLKQVYGVQLCTTEQLVKEWQKQV
jgi:nicotinamidase-related amidase